MDIGVTIRNMGDQSTADLVLACARAAESAGMESVWVTDHVAIPPDDAEGSGGRYLDTLTTLAWLGGATERIKLGSGVLILPYRPKLPTARQVATLQELTGERLILGVGAGWMDAEFRALGVERIFAVGDASVFTVDAFGPGGRHFNDQAALLEVLCAELRPGVSCLVKGSRSMKMEQVVQVISGSTAMREAG